MAEGVEDNCNRIYEISARASKQRFDALVKAGFSGDRAMEILIAQVSRTISIPQININKSSKSSLPDFGI